MFKKLYTWLRTEAHSVEAILADFHGTVERLHTAAAHKFAQADNAASLADNYDRMAHAAYDNEVTLRAEAQTAAEVAEKIKGLVTV